MTAVHVAAEATRATGHSHLLGSDSAGLQCHDSCIDKHLGSIVIRSLVLCRQAKQPICDMWLQWSPEGSRLTAAHFQLLAEFATQLAREHQSQLHWALDSLPCTRLSCNDQPAGS